MNIDVLKLGKVAGAISAIIGLIVLSWQYQPFALAEDITKVETKFAMDLETAIKQTSKLAVENAYGLAKVQVQVLEPEQEKLELQIIETELRDDLPPEVKQRFLSLLRRKQREVNGELTRSQNRVRSLAPVFAVGASSGSVQ